MKDWEEEDTCRGSTSEMDWRAEQATPEEEAPKEKDPTTLLTSAEEVLFGRSYQRRRRQHLWWPQGEGKRTQNQIGLTNLWEDPNYQIAKSLETDRKSHRRHLRLSKNWTGFRTGRKTLKTKIRVHWRRPKAYRIFLHHGLRPSLPATFGLQTQPSTLEPGSWKLVQSSPKPL